MSEPVGVGIIGVGFGANVHLPGYQHLPGARLLGIAASSQERAETIASQHGIEGYGDYRRLLDRNDVKLVSIAAPAPMHHEMALAAIERGKHVICEKPFAGTLSQAEDMLRRAEASGIVHAINFEFRFTPARQAMKALIAGGYVGQPRLTTALATNRGRGDPNREVKSWSVRREGLGGPLGAIAVHLLDSVCWLVDAEVSSVDARLETFFPERLVSGGERRPADAEDLVSIRLGFRGAPALATVDATFAAGQPMQRLEVHGSNGSLSAPDHWTLTGGQERSGMPQIQIDPKHHAAGGWRPEHGPDHLPWFAELASRVLSRIQGESTGDYPTFHDGLRSQQLVDAILRSSDSGRTIEL